MAKLFGVLIYNNILYLKTFSTFVYELCGYNTDKEGINLERFGAILSHEPGGSSIMNIIHWVQMFRKGRFHFYDYGKKKNLEIYKNA